MKKMNTVLIIVLLCMAVFMPAAASAKTYEEYGFWSQGCLNGAASALTVLYFPVKLGYGAFGTLSAGTVNLFSARYAAPTAEKIALTAAGGDWYITPRILLGEKKRSFVSAAAMTEVARQCLPILLINSWLAPIRSSSRLLEK
ncbi:MAG: hypothetical protein NTV89_10200 [Proteobacteria bacterium]|nr:hypothetical protein [Pseudomonadota bacterium]